jgi:2-oxoglutarate dehydrogenase E1 component
VLPDNGYARTEDVSQVILCSGKVYYDLLSARQEAERDDIALLRLEQLYPLRKDLVEEALHPYKPCTPVVWVQEEPENMGAWYFLQRKLGPVIAEKWPLSAVTRPESASPSTGSDKIHKKEQAELLERALGRVAVPAGR